MSRQRTEDIKVYGPGERYPGNPNKHNRWCVFQVTVAGKRIEKTCDGVSDKDEARSIAAEYLGAAPQRATEQRGQAAGPRTFRDLADAYVRDRGLRHKRRAQFLKRLCAVHLPSRGGGRFGDVPLADLRPNLAQEAANRLYGDEGLGTTKNTAVIGPFRGAIYYGAANDYLPLRRIQGFEEVLNPTPRPDPIELATFLRLLGEARPHPFCNERSLDNHRYREMFVHWLLFQGWRGGEALTLKWDQVNLRSEEIERFRVFKGRTVKNIDLSPEMFEALAAIPEDEIDRAHAERWGLIFPWLHRKGVYRWWLPLCKQHGLKLRPHMFRVEWVSRLDEGGASSSQIVSVSTHTDPRSAERYIRVDQATRKRVIRLAGQGQNSGGNAPNSGGNDKKRAISNG